MKKYMLHVCFFIMIILCAGACGKSEAENAGNDLAEGDCDDYYSGDSGEAEQDCGSGEEGEAGNAGDLEDSAEIGDGRGGAGSVAAGNAAGGDETADNMTDGKEASGNAAGENSAGKNSADENSAGKNTTGENALGENTAEERNAGVNSGAGNGISDKGKSESSAGTENEKRADASLGALQVDGTKLTDSSGNPVQLKGISTHGLAWYPDYVNQECVRQLKEEWGVNVFRLAMYTAEYGGYCSGGNKEELKTLVKNGVEYATDCGMYVIIDWHILSDGNPNTYLEEAKSFFGEMSETYADYTNVFYEICNEPNGGTSWSDVKSYAEQVIEVIRENDKDGIVLVGTPNWCQYVEQAAADPIEGYDNIMYTLHFYAATHKEELRDAMVRAVEAGLPVFVSEYGICDASGSGGIDEYQASQWVDTLNAYQISYVAWNLSNKGETSAVFKSSCNKVSGFTEEDLSDSGRWLYEMLGGKASAETANGSGVEGEDGTALTDDSENKEKTSAGENGQSGISGTEPEADNGPSGQGASSSGETKSTDGKFQDAGLNIGYQVVNSWGQGQESYYQYTLTITNLTGAELENWAVQLFFNGDIALSNGWNGNYQVEGNVMTITSMDYNGHMDRDGSVGNIGFIVQGPEGLDIQVFPAE